VSVVASVTLTALGWLAANGTYACTPTSWCSPGREPPMTDPAERAPAMLGMDADLLPVTSVWLTCQQTARDQRRGRYVPATRTHPAKMLPHLAAYAIAAYTRPGELVLDPMCGAGTALVEAVRAGRDAIGVDIEARFTAIAAANLALADRDGATGHGLVVTGDATRLPGLLPEAVRGRVALVVTSPPYGHTTHGLVDTIPGAGVHKRHHRYGRPGRGNLAYGGWDRLLDGFTQIMAGCHEMLRPGGIVVVTSRPVRRHRDDLIDLPTQVLTAAVSVGLEPVERCVALLAAVRGDQLIHRASMFAMLAVRRARADGIPLSVIAHEDVHVLRKLEHGDGAAEPGRNSPEQPGTALTEPWRRAFLTAPGSRPG
jgi:modification methylase